MTTILVSTSHVIQPARFAHHSYEVASRVAPSTVTVTEEVAEKYYEESERKVRMGDN